MKSYKALLIIFFISIIFLSCGNIENKSQTSSITTNAIYSNPDSGFKVINTTKVFSAIATKKFSSKNRKLTQFAFVKNSRAERLEKFKIKISDNKIILLDSNDKILKNLKVIKMWTDKSGPSTVYDLIDDEGNEYSLDYQISYNQKDYLAFRFGKVLECYSNE
jgi:hypothetical protein